MATDQRKEKLKSFWRRIVDKIQKLFGENQKENTEKSSVGNFQKQTHLTKLVELALQINQQHDRINKKSLNQKIPNILSDYDKIAIAYFCCHQYGRIIEPWQSPLFLSQERKKNGNDNALNILKSAIEMMDKELAVMCTTNSSKKKSQEGGNHSSTESTPKQNDKDISNKTKITFNKEVEVATYKEGEKAKKSKNLTKKYTDNFNTSKPDQTPTKHELSKSSTKGA